MADIVERIQDSFLSCTICFQPFNRPKALPCLHTFCEGCLRDFVTSRYGGMGQFPCPLCRQVTYLPTGGVSSLPDNHFIVGLSDTVSPYSIQESSFTEKTPLIPGTSDSSNVAHIQKETTNKLIRRFGNYGTQPYEFLQITGVAMSLFSDDIYLVDAKINKVSCYSFGGQFRGSFVCDCSVRDIAVTRSGTLLITVCQAENAILREYTVEGRLIASFGTFYRYENPSGLAITTRDQPVVTGLRQNCVHVFTQRRKPSVRFGSRGRGVNHFTLPHYVTTNSKDEIIVADCGNHRIKVHRLDGTFVRQFGKEGSKPGEMIYPMGICVDKFDNIYVADANNYRVQAFAADGRSLGFPVKDTFEYGVDVKPVNVLFSRDNVILVVLRGSKFCQVHEYFWDANKHAPTKETKWYHKLFCCI